METMGCGDTREETQVETASSGRTKEGRRNVGLSLRSPQTRQEHRRSKGTTTEGRQMFDGGGWARLVVERARRRRNEEKDGTVEEEGLPRKTVKERRTQPSIRSLVLFALVVVFFVP